MLNGAAVQINDEIKASLVGLNGKFDLRTCNMVRGLASRSHNVYCLPIKSSYEVNCCVQIMVPDRSVEGYYILYVFNMFTHVVHVFDPANSWQLETTLEKKHWAKYMLLLNGMSSLISELYPGYHVDASKWKMKCHKVLADRVKKSTY